MLTETETRLTRALAARADWIAALMDWYRETSRDVEGITRPSWGEVEEQGLERIAEVCAELGLEVVRDEVGQLFATLPGAQRDLPQLLIGSHFDSVNRGGHYDGYAGVLAALGTLAAMVDAGVTPERDVTLIGMRGEESPWYGIAYIGSRFTCGDLGWEEMKALRRVDTGKTLPEHIAALGYDPEAVRAVAGTPRINATNTARYMELHIEQGPVCEDAGISAAIPTAIRGNVRLPRVTCTGVHAHASGAPFGQRYDAVLATVEVLHRFEKWWKARRAKSGSDALLTVGKIHTDPGQEAMTVVPGACSFSFNYSSTDAAEIARGVAELERLLNTVAEDRRVRFEIGFRTGSSPQALDAGLRSDLARAAKDLDLEALSFPVGGHDAQVFAKSGIPAAMVLVRNQNGSHNPHEAMEMAHFQEAAAIYALAAARFAVA
ncbi:hydantoinase/carbamoylase family amidase [Mesorhizobium sp. B4-1-4]|uniref:hydantoinase/carbamoylase family amidase n=1 Tax=Mesorhizobium sp. B4-1-4 TaxID=2589888 RepID=UPI0015E2974C|nr:hydantoinase/carbamoylase family amidase [Mesorhizobium sp. B4-1-4]UCI31921.1 hydantoinase/carbamoylase family amidase [Mesorhizobium sp. B4-1-4]